MRVSSCFYGLDVFFACAPYYRPRLFSVGVPLRGRFALRLWWLTARFPRLAARGTRAFRFMHSLSNDGSVVAMSSSGRLQTSECDRDAARRRGHMYYRTRHETFAAVARADYWCKCRRLRLVLASIKPACVIPSAFTGR